MDKTFFGNQIDRLRGVYSPGSLNEERIQVIWRQFKNVENRVFENALSHMIGEITSVQLPAISKFAEAIGMFRTNPNGASMQEFVSPFECEPCRDFGFGFVGDTLVNCSCINGQQLNPAELARQQKNYDRGWKMIPNRAALKPFMDSMTGGA